MHQLCKKKDPIVTALIISMEMLPVETTNSSTKCSIFPGDALYVSKSHYKEMENMLLENVIPAESFVFIIKEIPQAWLLLP